MQLSLRLGPCFKSVKHRATRAGTRPEQIAIPAVLSELAERNKTVDGANSEARGKRRQWSTKEKKYILHGEKPST